MAPNPKCIVCSAKPQVVIKIDTKRVTVKQFRDEVLVKSLNMVDPDVIEEAKGSVLISSEEGETDCNNDKLLSDMEIVDGCILKVDDFFQNYELTVIIMHKEVEREDILFEIIADPETLKAEPLKEPEAKEQSDEGEPKAKRARREKSDDSDDDLCLIEDDDSINQPSTSSGVEKSAQQGSSTNNGSSSSAAIPIDGDDSDECMIMEEPTQNDAPSTSNICNTKSQTFSSLKRQRVGDDKDNDDDEDVVLIDID